MPLNEGYLRETKVADHLIAVPPSDKSYYIGVNIYYQELHGDPFYKRTHIDFIARVTRSSPKL